MNKPKIDICHNVTDKMSVIVDGKECGVFIIGSIKSLKLKEICRGLGVDEDYSEGKMKYADQYKRFSNRYGMGPKYFKKILIASVYREVIAPRYGAVQLQSGSDSSWSIDFISFKKARDKFSRRKEATNRCSPKVEAIG